MLKISIENPERYVFKSSKLDMLPLGLPLIDEADVFLQKRDGLDLQRNSLVSKILRRIE